MNICCLCKNILLLTLALLFIAYVLSVHLFTSQNFAGISFSHTMSMTNNNNNNELSYGFGKKIFIYDSSILFLSRSFIR